MSSKKVLMFVDDEKAILSSLKRVFISSPYEVLLCNSPEEAIEIIKQRPVDVIVSDYRMPGMTGADFLRIARDLRPETIRMVLSGYADAQVVTEMIEKGEIVRFLLKPWENEELKQVIAEGIKHQERILALS